ncbi:MAG TPA: helix-turn-helix domain-containing protein [Solirubrobacteraceae bacterium]|nr:helix-turn-helix domain-containing protein [Solirubrobacteraceae bacterium]
MTTRAEAAAATGERLLSAAWRHFATRPYEEVRLRSIATEAGVSAQTLHDRFGSKEELFTAAYAWFGRQEVAERPATPTDDVPSAVTQLYDRYEEHGQAVLRMLSQEERIPAVHQMTEAGRAYHRHWAATTFAPRLRGLRGKARERRLTAIVVATDLLVWKLLRHDMQHDRAGAERIVIEMIEPSFPKKSARNTA